MGFSFSSSLYSLSFHSLKSFFHKAKDFHVDEVPFIIFPLCWIVLLVSCRKCFTELQVTSSMPTSVPFQWKPTSPTSPEPRPQPPLHWALAFRPLATRPERPQARPDNWRKHPNPLKVFISANPNPHRCPPFLQKPCKGFATAPPAPHPWSSPGAHLGGDVPAVFREQKHGFCVCISDIPD